MRSIWKGMLSFGLVNVPIELVPATRKKSFSFNQLRKTDFSRIQYKKVASDGEEVTQGQIIRGYETSPGRYVTIEEHELDAIAPKASRIVEISDFVRAEEIDPRFYEASYYLMPGQGTVKAYALLLEGMREAQVVGIAKIIKHQKEYLAAIRPIGNALILSTMLFADELVDTKEIEVALPANVQLSEKERKLTRQLIDSLITKFIPENYQNEYYQKVSELIDSKTKDEKIVAEPGNGGMVIDIMAAIKASIAEIQNNEKPKIKNKKKKELAI